MNNPNPFVPQGSLLEQQSKRRSRLKFAVFCVLAVSVAGLTAMLIQGCKREQTEAENQPPPLDTNEPAMRHQSAAGGSVQSAGAAAAGGDARRPLRRKPPERNTSWSRAIRFGRSPRRMA